MSLRTRLTQPLNNTLKGVVFIADRRYNVYQTLFKVNVILPLYLQSEPMTASACLCRAGDTASDLCVDSWHNVACTHLIAALRYPLLPSPPPSNHSFTPCFLPLFLRSLFISPFSKPFPSLCHALNWDSTN